MFNRVAPLVATVAGFVAFAAIVPSNMSQKTDARIFTQGLTISVDHASPAYAALEDTLSTDTQSADEIADARSIASAPAHILAPVAPVVGGAPFIVAEKIVRENTREEMLMAQEREQRLANTRAIIASIGGITRGSGGAGFGAAGAARVAGLASGGAHGAGASGASGIDAETAQVLANGGTVVSGGQVLSGNLNGGAVITTTPAAKTAAVKTISRKEFAQFLAGLAKAAQKPASVPPSTQVAHISQARTAANVVKQEDAPAPANPNADVHQVVISGPVEFAGGIAITSSNDRVVIYRENNDEKLEPAQVWLKEAKYEVFVDQPIGRLVGELQTSSGETLGRGYFDLARLPKLATNQYRIDKISMTIAPIPHGITGRTSTAPVASEANPKAKVVAVANAHVQLGQLPFDALSKKDGTFKEDSLTEGSTVIVHADRPGHWGSLAFARAGAATEIPMFSDSAMRAIEQAATGSDHDDTSHSAFIWGRVTRGGQPVAGAHVDLMTGDTKPVYFNAMNLPDTSMTETGANGLYAFFPVEAGSQAVQAADKHGITEPSVVPTDEQTATQVNLELNVTRSARVKVYDAFKTDWPLSAELVAPGRKHGAVVPKSGEMTVTFTGGEGLLILDSDAGANYDRVRVTAAKTQHTIEVPMVQTVWLDQMRGALRLNSAPRTGAIVGFIKGGIGYQVSLENESLGPDTRIVYFDAHGEVIQYGVANGGFVIFNAPEGFRTVLIQPQGSGKALATAVLVEGGVTNVLTKSF